MDWLAVVSKCGETNFLEKCIKFGARKFDFLKFSKFLLALHISSWNKIIFFKKKYESVLSLGLESSI